MTSDSGRVTVWCTACRVTSDDAATRVGDVMVLRCDACGAESRVQRITPVEAVDQLAGMQAERGVVCDRFAPGDWTVMVAVMWRSLDAAFTDCDRAVRHDGVVKRWGGGGVPSQDTATTP